MNPSHPLTSRKPDDIIAHVPGGEISVEEFVAQVTTLAGELPDHQYVINLASNRYLFLLGFCAAALAGQCTLMPPNRQRQTLRQLIEEYPDCYSFGETGIEKLQGFTTSIDQLTAEARPSAVPEIRADQLCAIAFTSGSTGASTPHPKYWETVRESSRSNARCYDIGRDAAAHMLATVPPQHMWGFETSILLPLFANVAISGDTPLFPQDIANAVALLPRPRTLVSSPIHLDALLQADLDAICIDHILSATAPLSQQLARELEARFGARVTEVFGCSEAGSMASRRTATESLWNIADAFQLEIGEDKVRVIAQHLPERVVLNDIIELVDGNRFRWLGRDLDMINIAGKRGSLAHINHKLTQIPGVIDGVVFLPDENSKRLAGLVVAPGMEPSAILQELKETVDPAFLPRPFYRVAMLPRQETGKLARKMVLQLFESQRSRAQDDEELAETAS